MRLATATAAVVFALLICVSAVADIPEVISYQGVLNDDAGVPVADDTYSITFRLYDVETGGSALWEETQSVSVLGGIFNVYLGDLVSLTGLDFLNPYWLGIDVEGEGELIPRTRWTTVPYAGHAGFADTCLEGDEDWVIDGDDIHHSPGNVGVGVAPVNGRFEVGTVGSTAGYFTNAARGDTVTLRAQNALGTAGAFYSCVDPYPVPEPPSAVYGRGACGARGGHFYSTSGEALYAHTSGTTTALLAEATGSGYAAQFLGASGIQVQYRADIGSFRMFGGSSPGYVLTSDADGVGTWQPAAGSDADWTVNGLDMYSLPTGHVGIGDSTPDAKLDIATGDLYEALVVEHSGSPLRVVNIERTSVPVAGNDLLQIAAPLEAPDGIQFIECERGGSPVFYVMGDGQVVGTSGALFNELVEIDDGQLSVDYYGDRVAEISTVYTANGAHILHVEAPDTGETDDGIAVYGQYEQALDYGIGGKFEGGYIGAWGVSNNIGGSLEHIGVRAHATGGGTYNYGIYASASSATAYAGYFSGNVDVTGTLTADTKMFKIDHPLDPANKYLMHACVESDEMKNVYDGVVVLDGRGEARVTLPDWFEALNGEFRYQLTCIGAHAPVYVAEEIGGGSFAIAGGDPGMKVSWQVTGVRRDPYSLAHRADIVQDKPATEVGTYRHPELYGMPETAGVAYREERGVAMQEGLSTRGSAADLTTEDGD